MKSTELQHGATDVQAEEQTETEDEHKAGKASYERSGEHMKKDGESQPHVQSRVQNKPSSDRSVRKGQKKTGKQSGNQSGRQSSGSNRKDQHKTKKQSNVQDGRLQLRHYGLVFLPGCSNSTGTFQ